MKTLRLEIELEYDDDVMHGDDADAREWFTKSVIGVGDRHGDLLLHSNEIGDAIGTVTVLRLIET